MRERTGRLGCGWIVLAVCVGLGADAPEGRRIDHVFTRFDLPDTWEARFWGEPNAKALLKLNATALADLVPMQAGLRFCRCPACDATDEEDFLTEWSVSKPDVVTCRRCKATMPNAEYPAKDEKEKKVPEEVVEVLPRVLHKYPYHVVDAEKQRYPDERLYLAAKRDYEARQYLSKAALYAAVRHHEQPKDRKDPALAQIACVLVLRFAQVYPAYATHFDQPDSPKILQQADLPPPYRRGYRTGKWDWLGSLDVPLNLAIAYALVRDDPAIVAAGRALGDLNPRRTIEHDLFRASAEFVRLQPEEFQERSLQVYRGLLAVGRLLDDPVLVHDALARLDGFAERGFYHDGLWREGDATAHRRILGLIDGWLDRLLVGYADPPDYVDPKGGRHLEGVGGVSRIPMLALAQSAGTVALTDPHAPEIQQAAWPPVVWPPQAQRPALLGGAGLARLTVGAGLGTLDLELRGPDSLGAPHFQRQAIRMSVGGWPALSDLDDQPPTASGWDRATASHNTVVVDGLNQGESPAKALAPKAGGDFLFFAADPDFQVVTLDDPHAYPRSTTRYRQTMIAASGPKCRYAISVFEVDGGLQHDQLFHGPTGSAARWQVSAPMVPGPDSLLPPAIAFVPAARAEDGRWFVQAYGEFTPIAQGRLDRPATAWLGRPGAPGIRLHILGETPLSVFTVKSPDPTAGSEPGDADRAGRAGLIVRRRSENGATLKSTFVTVFEPIVAGIPPARVARVPAPAGVVGIALETADGIEHVVVNLEPGASHLVDLGGGQRLRTDGRVVRVSRGSLALAGGTFADTEDGRRVRQETAAGRITGVVRRTLDSSRGWFETDSTFVDPAALAGRVLLIQHGDGTTRGWTLQSVENHAHGARLYVREEPGFALDIRNKGDAHYYQFPRISAPAPHHFRVSIIAR